MMERRRALMGAKRDRAIGLVPGSGYGQSTSTIVAVDNNGYIAITKWSTAWANRFEIPFTGTLMVQSGDSVRVVLKKISGTGAVSSSSLWFLPSGWQIWNNQTTPFNNTTIKDITVTASKERTLNSFIMQLHSMNITTAFTMSIEIYINGKLVLK